MITNSAGFNGAKPTSMLTIPRLRSFCVVVSPSHLTKKALSGVLPWNAPWRNRLVIKAFRLRRILARGVRRLVQRRPTLCRERAIPPGTAPAGESECISTLTQSRLSHPSVSAPQLTKPVGKVRAQLTPNLLSTPFSRSVRLTSSPLMFRRSASVPAGASRRPGWNLCAPSGPRLPRLVRWVC